MIDESVKNYGEIIDFQLCSAEEISFKNRFDAIFCNSAFQWISNTEKAIKNFHRALRHGGRIGIQAPGGKGYSPNFLQAIDAVYKNKVTGPVFKNFNSPWFFLDTAREYTELFMKHKFSVVFSEIQKIESFHTPDEVYKVFASGAIAGYLNKDYYSCKIDDIYINKFQDIVREDFSRQADSSGKVNLIFNRIFLVAVKN
jgi:trans-aconitate methyltransferase